MKKELGISGNGYWGIVFLLSTHHSVLLSEVDDGSRRDRTVEQLYLTQMQEVFFWRSCQYRQKLI